MPVFSAHDSITKLALMTLAAFGFALVGLWAATVADLSRPDRAWMGWIIGLFFGLMGCIGLMRLWNAGEQVRISSEGIYVKQWTAFPPQLYWVDWWL
jgi:hypothetical protein